MVKSSGKMAIKSFWKGRDVIMRREITTYNHEDKN